MSRRSCARGAGFTLIEVMVALAILAGMMTLVWGSFSITVNSKRRVEEIEARYHQLRLAMNRMTREISMAYLSKNDLPATMKPRTMFLSERNSTVDNLMFSSLAHVRLRENAKECDQTLIRYYAAPDPDNRGVTNLMRRASRRLGVETPGEDGPAYIMLEDIEALHFEFFDEPNNEWRETWSTASVDGQSDRLPTKIRISVTMRDEADREVTFVTATRIYMQDPLWFSSGS
jgi:general secretion pathway protein J